MTDWWTWPTHLPLSVSHNDRDNDDLEATIYGGLSLPSIAMSLGDGSLKMFLQPA